MTTCPNGHQNTPGGLYCSMCAAPLAQPDPTPPAPQPHTGGGPGAAPPPPRVPPLPPGALLPDGTTIPPGTTPPPSAAPLPPTPAAAPPSEPVPPAAPGQPAPTSAPPPPTFLAPPPASFGGAGASAGGPPPAGPPPGGPPPASSGIPWYHQPWGVGLGLVMCFPFGLWALWTHPTWSKTAKQRLSAVVAAVVLLVGVTGTLDDTADEPAGTEQAGVADDRDDAGPVEDRDAATTSTRPRTTTTRPATTTTTIDPQVLRAEYDAQVAASCETVANASLAVDDGLLAFGETVHYDDRWESHAPESRFLEDVQYCGHQRREERRANECGGRPEVELLSRNPDQFSGQCFTVVMLITQFDQGTGPCSFRGYFDAVMREYNFEYKGDNSIISYTEPCPQLDPLGTEDVIRTRVVVVGGLTYDTTIGGSATAVQFMPVGDPEILENN